METVVENANPKCKSKSKSPKKPKSITADDIRNFVSGAINHLFKNDIVVKTGDINKEWLGRLTSNAQELIEEAEILGNHNKHRRALFLLLLAYEQIGNSKRLLKGEVVKRAHSHKETLAPIEESLIRGITEILNALKRLVHEDFEGIKFTPEELAELNKQWTPELKAMLVRGYKATNEFQLIIDLVREYFKMGIIRNTLLYEDQDKKDLFRSKDWTEKMPEALKDLNKIFSEKLKKDIEKIKVELAKVERRGTV